MKTESIGKMKKDKTTPLSDTVHLVWPNDTDYVTGLFTPLGTGYLAAYLIKKGFNVKIHDFTFSKKVEYDKKKAIYGISITTPLMNFAINAIRKIKRVNKGNIIVVGGPHATCVPKELMKDKLIDYVVVGEGEESLFELCKSLFEHKPVSGVKGLYYKEKNHYYYTGDRQPIQDLDSLPFPRHDLFPIEEYFSNRPLREMGLIASRGCPFNCEFCQPYLRKAFGDKVRYRSAKNIVDEMEYLKKKYNAHILVFNDDMANPLYFTSLCEEILKRKLKILWRCQARANLDRSTLKLMKKAGCIGIAFGVESGSQKVLNSIGKTLLIEDIIKVFRNCREVGLFAHAYIMVGNTGENMADILMTIRLIKRICPFSINVSITTPYPGTHLFFRLKREKKLPKKLNWELMHHIRGDLTDIKISNLTKEELINAKTRILEDFKNSSRISRFKYIISYISDISGFKNIFNFFIKNPRVIFKNILTLFSIASSGSGFKYTNPKL